MFVYISGANGQKLYRQEEDNSHTQVATLQEQEDEWILSVYKGIAYIRTVEADSKRSALQAIDTVSTVSGQKNNLYSKEKPSHGGAFLDFKVHKLDN